MISVVLYGRNDSYGYNLHKRAALSLNCMAEVLTDPDDELLFVDYNTPDDYPTFPEAIQDTLTDQAQRLLRVLRVRSRQHRQFLGRTHLLALEPVARNVAVRRSNPANRWILSTNTDMIFVPRSGWSVSKSLQDCPDGYYHTPRFEVPESLWETLPRMQPRAVIERIQHWGQIFHLNEVVTANDVILYDAPGDFQMMLRADLFDIFGFDERMLLGWHVDSNMCKRLYLKYGAPSDALPYVLGYHCDHTRQVTPMHSPNRRQNDLGAFFDHLESPWLEEQAQTWGMPEEEVEEIRLHRDGGFYVNALKHTLPDTGGRFTSIAYRYDTYDQISYDAEHVLPFLGDVLVNYPVSTRVGWFGCRRDLLGLFCCFWNALGARPPVQISDQCGILGRDLPIGAVLSSISVLAEAVDVFVFDFGFAPKPSEGYAQSSELSKALAIVAAGLRSIAKIELTRLEQGEYEPRRLIAVNAVHSRYERLVQKWIAAPIAPISTRLRQGFLSRQPPLPWSLLGAMDVGIAGVRTGATISSIPDRSGEVTTGPYLDLEEGVYRVRVDFEPSYDEIADTGFLIEVMAGLYTLALHRISREEATEGSAELVFCQEPRSPYDADETYVEFRVRADGSRSITLTAVTLDVSEGKPAPLELIDWLPRMRAGEASKRIVTPDGALSIIVPPGASGHVCWGPWAFFRSGDYVLRFQVYSTAKVDYGIEPIGWVEISSTADIVLAHRPLYGQELDRGEIFLPFEVKDRPDKLGGLEFKIWTKNAAFGLVAVLVVSRAEVDEQLLDQSPLSGAEPVDLLPELDVAEAGMREGSNVAGLSGCAGYLVCGPRCDLPDGQYRVDFRLAPTKLTIMDRSKVILDVVDGDIQLARRQLNAAEARSGQAVLSFVLRGRVWNAGSRRLEFRVWTNGGRPVELRHVFLCATIQ